MSKTKEAIAKTLTKVVDSLVALVESSEGNWIKPWVNLGLGRQFRSDGKLYQGTNQMFLSMIALGLGLEAPHVWAGYGTWQKMGWQVRKGESSPYSPILAYPVVYCKEHGKPEDKADRCCADQVRFMKVKVLRGVFHRTQVEAVTDDASLPALPEAPAPLAIQVPDIVESWKAEGMEFRMVDSDRAYFDPTADYINLPPVEAFTSEHGYYSTLLHEATHWTGFATRLDRPLRNPFGSPEYAAEELIAEMGSAMTGVVLGFEPEPHANHAEYLASWLKALKDDPTKLYDAAVEAEKASRMLLELGKVVEKELVAA